MRKLLFTLTVEKYSDSIFDSEAPKIIVDGFYKSEARYFDKGDDFSSLEGTDMHPFELDDAYKKDAHVMKSMELRGRFANDSAAISGVFCINFNENERETFDDFERENLQAVLDGCFENKTLQDFLNSARL